MACSSMSRRYKKPEMPEAGVEPCLAWPEAAEFITCVHQGHKGIQEQTSKGRYGQTNDRRVKFGMEGWQPEPAAPGARLIGSRECDVLCACASYAGDDSLPRPAV